MKCSPKNGIDTSQINRIRTLSSTILVVADSSLVTEIPAKLKNAMLKQISDTANCVRKKDQSDMSLTNAFGVRAANEKLGA